MSLKWADLNCTFNTFRNKLYFLTTCTLRNVVLVMQFLDVIVNSFLYLLVCSCYLCTVLYGMAQKERMFFISACNFFLWGYLKSKVCVRKPRTVDVLKVSIREEIATVPQEMLVNVMQNFEERLRTCVRQEGRHLSDLIFRNWVINVSNQTCRVVLQ